jgi:hypothetical protein
VDEDTPDGIMICCGSWASRMTSQMLVYGKPGISPERHAAAWMMYCSKKKGARRALSSCFS